MNIILNVNLTFCIAVKPSMIMLAAYWILAPYGLTQKTNCRFDSVTYLNSFLRPKKIVCRKAEKNVISLCFSRMKIPISNKAAKYR